MNREKQTSRSVSHHLARGVQIQFLLRPPRPKPHLLTPAPPPWAPFPCPLWQQELHPIWQPPQLLPFWVNERRQQSINSEVAGRRRHSVFFFFISFFYFFQICTAKTFSHSTIDLLEGRSRGASFLLPPPPLPDRQTDRHARERQNSDPPHRIGIEVSGKAAITPPPSRRRRHHFALRPERRRRMDGKQQLCQIFVGFSFYLGGF